MPQSNEGVLLVIGALFLLLGLLGGGFEVAALKVPPIGKYTRAIAITLGALVFSFGLFRLLFAPAPIPLPPPVIVPTTAPPTFTPPPPTPLPTVLATNPPPTLIVPTPTIVNTTAPTSADIDDIRVEYDVTRFERNGMIIHLKFRATGLKGIECKAVAYFYQRTGEPLKDQNGTFHTVDGNVSASEVFTPGFDTTVYDDLQVFMPYNELELGPGKYALKFHVEVYALRDTQKSLAISPDVNFEYSK